jgi:kinesin family protein 18/19
MQFVPAASNNNTSLIVGVRVRPLLRTEQSIKGKKDILRVIDGKVVVVLDPDESKVMAAVRAAAGSVVCKLSAFTHIFLASLSHNLQAYLLTTYACHPHTQQDYLDQVQHRTKERRYTFDVAFDFSVSAQCMWSGGWATGTDSTP